MAVDYDLVILGGTLEGRRGAMKAARYGARVALVEVPGLFEANQRQRYLLQGLQQLGQGLQQQTVGQWFGFGTPSGSLDWQAVLEWCAIAAETQSVGLSAELLGRQGVDVVMAVPERLSRELARSLVVMTAGRRLRSRAVLAAFGLSPDALEPLIGAESLPNSVVILGGNTRAIKWAQALCGVGVVVTLQTPQVLPGWDDNIRKLLRSQLITSGVRLNELESHSNKINPQPVNPQPVNPQPVNAQPVNAQPVNTQPVNTQPVNTQSTVECTLLLDTESPALSLPQFVYGSKGPSEAASADYLSVNNRLQSAHSRVFACGPLLGGSVDEGLAEYEAEVAVNNALFLPRHQANSEALAQGSDYFARVGLNERQAEQRYGASTIYAWDASGANSADLLGPVPLRQYCKIICCQQQIVGIHLFGEGSFELAQSLAMTIGRPINEINSVVFPSQGLLAVVKAAARSAVSARWQVGHWPRDWAENWFNWRRSS